MHAFVPRRGVAGSFLDHLQFCYEYSASYFKEHSPRVLFLHSILGVGTNIFPMKKEDEPALAAIVSAHARGCGCGSGG